MSGFYYLSGSYPVYGSQSNSVLDKAELAKVQAGFDKFPTPTGFANHLMAVNAGETGWNITVATLTTGGILGGLTGLSSSGAVDFTGGTVHVPTRTAGDSSDNAASTAFVTATAFAAVLPGQLGNSGKFLTTDGSNASWTSISTAQTWTAITAANSPYTATSAQRLSVDTSGGVVTVNLPAAPSAGHYVEFTDGGGAFATNSLTIARNGKTIMGLAEDMTISTNNAGFGLEYTGSTWRLF